MTYLPGGAIAYPKRATMWHDEATVTVGVAIAHSIDTSASYNDHPFQNTGAGGSNGDTFTHSFVLAAGTYTLFILGQTAASCGKIDWYIDGVSIATAQDWYTASQIRNVVKTVGSLSISDGVHQFKGIINGKNGSSASYNMQLEKYWLAQASD